MGARSQRARCGDGASREDGCSRGAPPAVPAQPRGAGRARPAGTGASPGDAVGGHLLPPPVRRAMPCGEGAAEKPPPASPWGSGSAAHACEGSQHLSRPGCYCWLLTCLTAFFPVSTVQWSHFFPQFVFSGSLGHSEPQTKNDQYQQLGGSRPVAISGGELAASLWQSSSGENSSPFSPSLQSTAAPSSTGLPSQLWTAWLGLDSRAGCATLLCQRCLLAARPWPGGCPALASPHWLASTGH